jgi:hypothetical protein
MFTIRWVRKDRECRPQRDNCMTCLWPLPPESCEKGMGEAFLTMIDGVENLPLEVQSFLKSYNYMTLRMTYNSSDISGVYVVDSPDGWGIDDLDRFIATTSDQELKAFIFNGGVNPRYRR